MEPRLIIIGVDPILGKRLSAACQAIGAGVTFASGPGDIPLNNPHAGIAVLSYLNAETFQSGAIALKKRNIRHVIALLNNEHGSVVADAFRSGASDVMFAESVEAEVHRSLSLILAKERHRKEPMDVRPLQDVERDAISAALEACRGQVSLTARRLGIGRSTLYRKIEQYALVYER